MAYFGTDIETKSLNAAMEIDNVLQGCQGHVEILEQVLSILQCFPPQPQAPKKVNYVDPSLVVILNNAVRTWETRAEGLSSIYELSTKVTDIHKRFKSAYNLMRTGSTPQEAELKRLRSFCLALSRSASSYKQALKEIRIGKAYPLR